MAAKSKRRPAKAKVKARRKPKPNPLYNPDVPLRGRGLRRAAEALTYAEIHPQRAALKAQRADVTAQGNALVGHADNYYRQMAEREAGAVAQARALQDRVGQQVREASDASKVALDQAAGEAAKAVSDAQATTGVDAGVRQRLAAEVAAARSNQALQGQASAGAAANTAGNYGGLLTALGQARELQGGETHRQLANRVGNARAQLTQKIADLGPQRAAVKTKNLTTLRQTSFENEAVAKQFGLKAADIAQKATAADAAAKLAGRKLKASERHNKRNEDIAAGRLGESHRHNTTAEGIAQQNADTSRQRANKPPKPKPESQSAKNIKIKVTNAISRIHQWQADGATGPEITRHMHNEGYSDVVINAARDIVYLGGLSGTNRAVLRDQGVHIPKAWRRPHPRRRRSAIPRASQLTGRPS